MELILILLLLKPSGKLSKTLTSTWRITILGSPLWQHSLTTLLRHDPTSDHGLALSQWVHSQGVQKILDLLSWDQEETKHTPAQQV